MAIDTSQVLIDTDACKSVLINQVCSFTVDTRDNNQQGTVKTVVTSKNQKNKICCSNYKNKFGLWADPDGNHIQAKVINNQDSTWKVEFLPTEIGEYYIEVFYGNQLVAGSPFKSNVFDPSHIKIVPCLHGIVDQIAKFEGIFRNHFNPFSKVFELVQVFWKKKLTPPRQAQVNSRLRSRTAEYRVRSPTRAISDSYRRSRLARPANMRWLSSSMRMRCPAVRSFATWWTSTRWPCWTLMRPARSYSPFTSRTRLSSTPATCRVVRLK